MTSGYRCDACEGPNAGWIASRSRTLCPTCERAGPGHRDREPVLVGDVLAAANAVTAHAGRTATAVPEAPGVPGVPEQRSSGTTSCKSCGRVVIWHRTVNGRWIMIEPGDWLVGSIPAGKRWRIAGDGTAVSLGRASPSDTCRICHFDVCPSGPAPANSPSLLLLWRGLAQRGA
ncbi:DUF6083 domain-containing protein [Streptomyces sp. NPDC088725]|uniref:DUF6083 domain-containing protein n=1 Tax=Streptomyces sp. NPDC088725 TaxID=3365873 RepID=UPI0037F34D1D